MKKLSEHIGIYLIQKESLFSILGRISINTTAFLFPLVFILDNYSAYFLYKWLFILILFYHIVYGLSKLLTSDSSISGTLALIVFPISLLQDFVEEGYSMYFYVFLLLHALFSLGSVFADYLLSDLDELRFFEFESFLWFLVTFFSIYCG